MPFGLKLKRIQKEEKKKKKKFLQKSVKEPVELPRDPRTTEAPDIQENVNIYDLLVNEGGGPETAFSKKDLLQSPGPPTPKPPQEVKPSSWGLPSMKRFSRFKLPGLGWGRPKGPAKSLKKSFRIPGLLAMKRVFAAILFLVNMAVGFVTIPIDSMGLFFWLNGFIFLDYLWKTRFG